MGQTLAHVVRVLTDNGHHHFWLAAAPPDEAITRVLNAVPEGWAATVLLNYELSSTEVAALQLGRGDVREITSRTN